MKGGYTDEETPYEADNVRLRSLLEPDILHMSRHKLPNEYDLTASIAISLKRLADQQAEVIAQWRKPRLGYD